MAIRGTLSRTASIGGKVAGSGNVRAKQVAIGQGGGATDLTSKSISDLGDVNATETDDGLLQYDASSDSWTTTTVVDGGTF